MRRLLATGLLLLASLARAATTITLDTTGAMVKYTAQTGAIGSTTIMTPARTGVYRVSVYVVVTTAGTSGRVDPTIAWTDSVTGRTSTLTGPVITATNATNGIRSIASTATAISFSTALTGTAGSLVYNIYIRCQRMGDILGSDSNLPMGDRVVAERVGETASISAVTMTTAGASDEMWRYDVYAVCTSAGSAGTLTVTLAWTDSRQAASKAAISGMSLTATNASPQASSQTVGTAYVASGNTLTYATTVSGASGAPVYSFYVVATRVAVASAADATRAFGVGGYGAAYGETANGGPTTIRTPAAAGMYDFGGYGRSSSGGASEASLIAFTDDVTGRTLIGASMAVGTSSFGGSGCMWATAAAIGIQWTTAGGGRTDDYWIAFDRQGQ